MNVTIRETKLAIAQHEHGNLPISTETGKGFRPYELFISAITGCAGMTFAKIAEKQRLAIENIELVTDVKRIQEEANRISEIQLHFIIKGLGLSKEKIEKNINLTVKNCGMIQSVKDSITILTSFELK